MSHKSWEIFKLEFKTYEYEILKNSLTINICIVYILVLYNFCLKMVSIDLRKTILKMHSQAYKMTLISRILDMPNSTVWNIIRKFQTTKEVADLPQTGRPRCMRTLEKIKAIKERVQRNSKRSMRKMSRILEMSVTLYPWECIF